MHFMQVVNYTLFRDLTIERYKRPKTTEHLSQSVRKPITNSSFKNCFCWCMFCARMLLTVTYFISQIRDCKFKILDNTSCCTDSCNPSSVVKLVQKNMFWKRLTIAKKSTTAILLSKQEKSKSISGNILTPVVTNQKKV